MRFALIAALVASLVIHAALLLGTDLEIFVSGQEPLLLHVELQPMPVRPAPTRPPAPSEPPERLHKPLPRAAEAARPPVRKPAPPAILGDAPLAPPTEPAAPEETPPMPAAAPPAPPFPVRPLLPATGTIRFAIFKESLGLQIGRAEHRWQFTDDGRYRLTGTTETSGLAAVFKPVRMVVESSGRLVAGGLQPERYTTLRNGRDAKENADFDWSTARVTLSRDGSVREVLPGTQDLLSLNYQLAYLGTLAEGGSIGIVTGKKYARYALDSLGEEDIEVPAGRFRTLHLRAMTDSVTEVWIALDRQRLPVKIRFTDKKGDSYVQVATELGSE